MPTDRPRRLSYSSSFPCSLLFAGASLVWCASLATGGEPNAARWRAAGAEAIVLESPNAGMSASVTAVGITCSARSKTLTREARDVTVSVRTTSFGRVGVEHAVGRGALATSGDRVEIARAEFTEWFTTHEAGIEQGWTIAALPPGERESPLWIGLAFEGLSPMLDERGTSARLVDERAQDRLYYRGLSAVDAQGRALVARLVVGSNGVGITVDARGAAYPITVDPVLSALAWSFQSDQAGAQLGTTAWTAGDVNGDGFSDLVAGAPTYTQTLANEGAALVWFGPLHGVTSPPDQVLQASPPNSNNQFGGATAVGDANGDGYEDIVVVAPGYSNGSVSEGGVYLYLGGPAGLTGTGTPFFEGNQFGAEIGRGLAAAGDVNADGYDDVLVGSGTYDRVGFTDNGVAFLFLGSATGYSATPAWSGFGDRDAAQFGEYLAGVGDIDADGYDDWVIGAHAYANPDTLEGAAFVYRGSATATIPTTAATLIREGNQPSAVFGGSVNAAGDVNGDGYADVLVGAMGLNGGLGLAFLYYGSATGLGASPWTETAPSGTNEGYASRVATAGDVDGDGFADILVSAADYQTQGRVLLYLGSQNGPVTPAAGELLHNTFSDLYGYACVTAGDVNGDGLSDVLVGDPYYSNPQIHEGSVEIYLGQPPETPANPPAPGELASLTGFAASRYGGAVSNVGDITNDGYTDLVVGASEFDASPTLLKAGRAELRRGSANGVEHSPIWFFDGTQADARFGASIAWAGDVNNDGRDDLIVGEPRYDGPEIDEGQVHLFLGRVSGAFSSTPVLSIDSDEVGARFGETVAAAGDVNGDGFADILVGAPGLHLGEPDRGAVYLFFGTTTGLRGTPTILDGPAAGFSRFGSSVASAGDLNRDGYSDMIVGAPLATNTLMEQGRVYVYLGSPSNSLGPPAWTLDGTQASAHFGFSVASAGDVDADGFADLLIGAPDWLASTDGGHAFVFRGRAGVPPVVTPAVADLYRSVPFAGFGARVAPAGDANDDGHSDMLVAAPADSLDRGLVAIHLGHSAGVGSLAAQVLLGPGAGARFGEGLGPCGDVDGDGFSDVVAGEPGLNSSGGGLLIYSGGGTFGSTSGYQQRQHSTLDATRLLGVVNDSSTGFGLFLSPENPAGLSASAAGRERIALEVEVDPFATLLDGSGLERLPFQDSGALTGSLSLAIAVDGLVASSGYHWRSRLATANPLFPHGHWLSVQGNGRQEKKLGTGFDCDNDGSPDATEIVQNPSLDCDLDGGLDSCQIAQDPGVDCDQDGALNACELLANDCDGNSYPDDCQLAQGEPNCNGNNVLDACELNGTTDVNGDAILDVCQFVPFCFGDGTGAACPCGNSGGAGRGCANSVNANGAVLTVTGVPSITNDTLVLHGAGMPNSVSPSAIYLQGTQEDNLGLGTPIQDGLRCVTGSLIRLGTRPNSGNQSQYPDVGNVVISIRGQLNTLPMPQTRYYQVFYRNAATAFCPPGTANWTNGLAVTWHP